jgi:hypothetical protein
MLYPFFLFKNMANQINLVYSANVLEAFDSVTDFSLWKISDVHHVIPIIWVTDINTIQGYTVAGTSIQTFYWHSVLNINGTPKTTANDLLTALQDIVNISDADAASGAATPTITSVTPMQAPDGTYVLLAVKSDGSRVYTLADGSPYTGNTTLLLPYSKGGEKQLVLPASDFAVSGAFDYLLTKAQHGIELINSVEVGSSLDTLSAITNYTIAPNGDLTISTNTAFTTEIIRITGNY